MTKPETCEARVFPLKEKKMRRCGMAAKGEHDGRQLCERHLRHAKGQAHKTIRRTP